MKLTSDIIYSGDKRVMCKCGRLTIWDSEEQCRKCRREAIRKWQKKENKAILREG